MTLKKDATLGQVSSFSSTVQILDIPNEIKIGYSPIAFVRTGRAACKISKLDWKMSNEMAQVQFEPQQPFVCDNFKNCEGLSRVAFMDGNGVVMLGKITAVVQGTVIKHEKKAAD